MLRSSDAQITTGTTSITSSTTRRCANDTDCFCGLTGCIRDRNCTQELVRILSLNTSSVFSYVPSVHDSAAVGDLVQCLQSTEEATEITTIIPSSAVTAAEITTPAPYFLCGPGCVSSFDRIQVCAYADCSIRMTQCTNDPVCLELLIAMQINPRAARDAQLDYPIVAGMCRYTMWHELPRVCGNLTHDSV